MRFWRALVAPLASIGLLAATASASQDLPRLTSPVTDLTDTLTQHQLTELQSKVLAFEQRKGSQVVVLIVASTAPASIEDYAVRVFEYNALGRAGVDDGVLLVVAKDDRRVRIEVGYGLEGAVPDAIAGRIIAEYLTPRFREGNFYGGIDEAVDRLIASIDGEPLPEPLAQATDDSPPDDWFPIAVFIGGFVGSIFASMRRKPSLWMGLSGSATSAVIAWFFLTAVGAIVVAALVGFFVGLMSGASSGGGGGGYSSGRSGSGGWSGGGSSSGGSWSGGGGRSGGGGASGSW